MNKKMIVVLVSTVLLLGCVEIQKIDAADAEIQLGLAYLEQQSAMSAKKKFLLALQNAPKYSQSWDAMAYYMDMTGDKETAAKYYKYAIKLAPKDASVHNNYGVFLCKQGEYIQALQQFDLALADKNYLKTAQTNRNAGLCALKIPNTKLADAYFRRS